MNNFLLDIPRFKAYIDRQYLTDGNEQGREEAYVFAVTLIESRPLLFTIHTIFGAVYSRIPIEAIAWKPKPTNNSIDRWGAISGNAQVIQHRYLKDYFADIPAYKTRGRYHCTIDYYDGGFAQDPEQHKTTNILFGDDGAMYALPNNEVIFRDDHFTDDVNVKTIASNYKRNTEYYV